MKAAPLLVSWHNESSPIYSADFDRHGKGRLATAGGDNNVRLWSIETNGEERKLTYLSTLVRHSQSINVVRFCPKGEMLASAGDDGNVILWVPSEVALALLDDEHVEDKETWRVKHMCRSSTGAEIYDLAWSPDGVFFITGGVDNTARIFNAQTGQLVRQISEHSHYVQGVAWDPLNEYIATQSSDRSVHIYGLKLKDGTCTLSNHGKVHKIDLPGRRVSSHSPAPPDLSLRLSMGESHRHSTVGDGHRPSPANEILAIASPSPSNPGTPLNAALPMVPPAISHSRRSSFGSSPSFRRSASPAPGPSLPLPAIRPEISSPSLNAAMGLGVRNTNIYHNETLTSFFRRLTFAPDGSLLFTPSGQFKSSHPSSTDPSKTVDEVSNTVYIYTRAGFNKPPIAHLPGHKKPSVAVKCSPVFYSLRQAQKSTTHITIDTTAPDSDITLLPDPAVPTKTSSFMEPPSAVPPSLTSEQSRPQSSQKPPDVDASASTFLPAFALPYRIVYAVATQDAVHVYDTQQQTPLCIVSNLHFTTFSDLSWSNDGLTLLMSSTDGYCSTLAFSPGELGQIYNGPHPTMSHPAIPAGSANAPPVPSPINTASPSMTKASPSLVPSIPSPAGLFFSVRPGSPTRSNSQSSVATMSSIQTLAVTNNPMPTLSHLPIVTATNSAPVGLPQPTPPQTPMAGGGHSATSSMSGSVLGKRDVGVASESEKEDGQVKKRRIAPTLVKSSGETAPPGKQRTKS